VKKKISHSHAYLTLKSIPVFFLTRQKLAFLSFTIPITLGKIEVLFLMYGHSQPLKQGGYPIMSLLINFKITSDIGQEWGKIFLSPYSTKFRHLR
jgi:hypothetical protein